jgi:hypothetical protein
MNPTPQRRDKPVGFFQIDGNTRMVIGIAE